MSSESYLLPGPRVEPGGRHETAPDGLDLLDVLELRQVEELLEVTHEFVQDPKVLLAPFVRFVVEVIKVGDLGEDDSDVLVVLAVVAIVLQLVGHVLGHDDVQQPVGLLLLFQDLLLVFGDLVSIGVESDFNVRRMFRSTNRSIDILDAGRARTRPRVKVK